MDRLDQYRLFLRIAACGSFSLAAEQLGLPRPTVSTGLQQLEARLGTRLLHRSTRRVSLTPDGEALLERAQALVSDMEEIEQRFRPAHEQVSGRLRVDVPSRIARRLLAPALPDLLARHPRLAIDLGSSDRMVDLVQEGIDCALRVGQLAPGSLVARPLGGLALINCASPAYLARHGTPTTPEQLHQPSPQQHLAVHYGNTGSERGTPWDWLDAQGQRQEIHLPSRVSANNAEAYIALALAGLGLIQIPAVDVREHLERGELLPVLPQHRPAPMPVHLVYPHRRQWSRRLQVFLLWTEGLLAPWLNASVEAAAPP